MNYQEYILILKRQAASQEYESQLRFAVLVCKKLYADYKKFNETENWGDADLLMDAINICQQAVQGQVDINAIKAMIPQIDLITPNMDDFGNVQGSYALNASAAVYETLEFIIDKHKIHIYNIATYYTDTIDFRINEENSLPESEIEKHPLMIEAWNFVIDQTRNSA